MRDDTIDAVVRTADPYRWLASRFIADDVARADVVALYGFDVELARTRRIASNPLIADIRLAWWREAVEEIRAGAVVRAHPVVRALAAAVGRGLDCGGLLAMIEGHGRIVGATVLDDAQSADWAGSVAGVAARLAAERLDRDEGSGAAAPAGQLWGYVMLARQGLIADAAAERLVMIGLGEARQAARRLPSRAFPAVAHACLARSGLPRTAPGPLESRLRLFLAVASGQI
jgi:15-cis-phytoene synthase